MAKPFFLLISLLLLVSCGQKSEIETEVPAERLTATKDTATFVVPLSEEEISSFQSPVKDLGVVIGGVAQMFLDLAVNLGLGNKMALSMVQQVPKLPVEYLKHIKIKRVFFYIESPETKERLDFGFLDELAIKVSTHTVENTQNWMPLISTKLFKQEEAEAMKRHYYETQGARGEEELLLRYAVETENVDLVRSDMGKTFIIKNNDHLKTRKFFEEHPQMRDFFQRIHYINHDVLIELKQDPVVEESFSSILNQEREKVEALGMELKNVCSNQRSCMNFRLSDVDLIPIIQMSNALKLDCFLEVRRAPHSFQLKGFVEFEIKFNKETIKI